jgi:hypothetical protein
MNVCIKTGARLYLVPYGRTVPADIYQVATARVARIQPAAMHGDPVYSRADADWLLRDGPGQLWREDAGFIVAPMGDLTEVA